MSLVIDEAAVQRFAEANKCDAYTVTALNLIESAFDQSSDKLIYPSSVASTIALDLPNMSADTVKRLLSIRQQIVASGSHLMSTTELDNEVAERKRHI